MKYAKFAVAVATALGIALGAALTDDHVTTAEWVAIVLAGLGALGVYAIPNKPAQDTPEGADNPPAG